MVTSNVLQHRAIRWLLIDGDRLAVAGLTVAAMFGVVLAVDPVPSVVAPNATPLFYLFSSLLGGNLNLLTVVVAINQLVYSRELKSTGKLRGEIQAIGELRQSVADASDRTVAPIAPADFVHLLLDELREDLEHLAADVGGASGGREPTDATVELLVTMLEAQLDSVQTRLTRSHGKTVDVLGATLTIDFPELNVLVTRVQNREERRLSAAGRDAVDAIGTRLEQLVLVRNHFESIYTQENLAQMSRQLLFVGVPVEFLTGLVLLSFVGLLGPLAPATVPSEVIYLLFVLGLTPLAVVFSFVIRAVTIARQTAITNQFITQRNAEQWHEQYRLSDDESQ